METSTSKRMPRGDRRQQIIDSAIRVFGAKGFRAATTAELAKSAEISEALLYQHFPSKQALLIAVIDHVGQIVYDGLQSILTASKDPSVTMVSLFESLKVFSEKYPESMKLGVTLSTEFEDPEILKAVRKIITRSVDLLSRALSNGQKHQIIRADIDADAMAWMVVSLYQTYGLLGRVGLSKKMDSSKILQLVTPFLGDST